MMVYSERMKKMLLFIILTILSPSLLQAEYDVENRFRVLMDRFETEEFLRPFGHDFLLDITASVNKNLFDVIDEADEAANTEGETSDKVAAASTFLEKYDKTEQTARAAVHLGFPLFTFNAFGIKFVPDFRIGAKFGINIGIRTTDFSVSDISSIVQLGDEGIDQAFIDKVTANITTIPDGPNESDRDIAQILYDQGAITEAEYNATVGKYIVPEGLSTTQKLPQIQAYTKLDIKSGLLLNFSKKYFFGYVNLYGLHRTDFKVSITSEDIARDKGITDGADNKNSQIFAMTDIQFGYKRKRWQALLMLEELKIARIKDNISTAGDLIYGTDPLIRLHGDYLIKLSVLNLNPFLGIHKRSGYDFGDGVYAGIDLGAYVWGDRLGLQFRTMFDQEHLTLSPRMKLWFMQLEYSLKQPMSSTKDDVKVSALHSLNFRLFF